MTASNIARLQPRSHVATATARLVRAEHLDDAELLANLLRHHGGRQAADQVLAQFGSIGEAAAATTGDFQHRTDLDLSVLQDLQLCVELAARLAREPLQKRSVINSWSALLAYVRAKLANESREQFRILFLDKKNQLIRDELMSEGTIDHAAVYTREVMRRALELQASAMILIHNHPSGDPTPSMGDIATTKRLVKAAKALELSIHDHLVIGSDGVASFKSLGLLEP